ncbi:DUF4030 domain-containing protein [Fictibacillus sp. BK138]|uniref:DUF4030 domain-containing protein n=1 Tax=Fictibacillus sp. BK138 TaxID=2512121 RepID=UPI0010296D87|nr:DUF4030 domain-containing protein [Fictibacillus sp. BK138]RZT15546.1 uncharacterized protein DUF4030 [Fictibacillus sp. BK138]
MKNIDRKLKEEIHTKLEQIDVPKSLYKFIETVPSTVKKNKIDEKMNKNTLNYTSNNKAKWLRKKRITFSLAFVATFCLFIGGAFVSPSVAQMASTIPYLNLIFENKLDAKPLNQEITQALYNKEYKNVGVRVSIKDKEVEVMVIDSEEYYTEVKSPIKDLIKDILKARNEENYKINVLNDPVLAQEWSKMNNPTEQDEEFKKVMDLASRVLKKYGYNSFGHETGKEEGLFYLQLPNTETRVKEILNEINERLKQEQMEEYSFKVHFYDPKIKEREERLEPLYRTITKGLTADTDFKVDGVGYSNKSKENFYIEIRTTLSSDDPDKVEVINKIRNTVEDFLHSEQALKLIKEYKYKIVIFSKDKEALKILTNK